METLFKVTKKSLTGQSISVFIESDKFTNDIDLLANRRQQIEVIQNCLDQVQNRAKNFLSEKNYYTLYNLRCDIQDELTDLNGEE